MNSDRRLEDLWLNRRTFFLTGVDIEKPALLLRRYTLSTDYSIKGQVFTLALAHLVIDLASAYHVTSCAQNTSQVLGIMVLYNFIAFALQMPFGLIIDNSGSSLLCAVGGCLLVAASLGLSAIPLLAVIITGLGNNIFHLGAGVRIMRLGENKGILGLFIAPGAWGVYGGTYLSRNGFRLSVHIILALLIIAGFLLRYNQLSSQMFPVSRQEKYNDNFSHTSLVTICIICLVVVLRSFVSMSLDSPFSGLKWWGPAQVTAVVAGKLSGGILADRLDIRRTIILSMLTATLLFWFPHQSLLWLTAVFCFNMTMPLTLWLITRELSWSKGFAFGLLSLALFLGYLPVQLGWRSIIPVSLLLSGLSLLSLLLLCYSLQGDET